jgi:hypothetical protein
MSAAQQFIADRRATCLFCHTQHNQLSDCKVIIGHRVAPRVIDVFGQIGSWHLGSQYNLPYLMIAENAMKKTFQDIPGGAQDALFQDFEVTGIPARVATQVLVVGKPTEIGVCRFCSALPHISRSASGILGMEKAVPVSDGLWALSPQKFGLGLIQMSLPGFPEAELREFGNFARPDPTR